MSYPSADLFSVCVWYTVGVGDEEGGECLLEFLLCDGCLLDADAGVRAANVEPFVEDEDEDGDEYACDDDVDGSGVRSFLVMFHSVLDRLG